MLVRDRMTCHPISVDPGTAVTDALDIIRQNYVRRLPVVDGEGRLVGIVSEKDLLRASPSPLTCLSVYKVRYVLSRVKVKDVMASDVITVEVDTPLEEAARLMVRHKIGGLPVVRDGKLVGIITETDLFKTFMEVLRPRERGLRISLSMAKKPGGLARLIAELSRLEGDIISVGTFHGKDCTYNRITVKVQGVPQGILLQRMEGAGAQVVDVGGEDETAQVAETGFPFGPARSFPKNPLRKTMGSAAEPFWDIPSVPAHEDS